MATIDHTNITDAEFMEVNGHDVDKMNLVSNGEEIFYSGKIMNTGGAFTRRPAANCMIFGEDRAGKNDRIWGNTIAWNQLVSGATVVVPSGHTYLHKGLDISTIAVSSGETIQAGANDNIFDLTQMFGNISGICTSLRVGNLTTEANKALAVDHFKELFPLDYYPYDPGRLLDTSLVKPVPGWNQLVKAEVTTVTVPNGHVYILSGNGVMSRIVSDGEAFDVNPAEDNVFDLTQIFGAGNEPATPALFNSWMHAHGLDPDTYQDYTTGTTLPGARIEATPAPEVGQIVTMEDDGYRHFYWPDEIPQERKADAVGVIFAKDNGNAYIVGENNLETRQWSCVADYEITAIPGSSAACPVTLNSTGVGTFNYVKGDGTIREFCVQLEAFLRDTTRADYNAKCAKWESYWDPAKGKGFLQMWQYDAYEGNVGVAGATLVKLIGSELAAYTNNTVSNQIGQVMNYWTGLCRDRLEAYCTTNGSVPAEALDGVTKLHENNNAPVKKIEFENNAYCAGLREHFATYGVYLDACMTKLDKSVATIVHYWDGREQTGLLATKDVLVRGVQTPAYPAADYAIKHSAGKDGFRAGAWWLPSMYELGLLMRDVKGDGSDLVNVALTALGWSTISTTSTRWSCCRYNSGNAWSYNDYGRSNDYYFYYSFAVSVVSTLPLQSPLNRIAPPKSVIPDIYQEVEYIESPGDAFIDSNIMVNSGEDFVIHLKFKPKYTEPWRGIFGSMLNNTSNQIMLGCNWNMKGYINVGAAATTERGEHSNNELHYVTITNYMAVLDGKEVIGFDQRQDIQLPHTLLLFAYYEVSELIYRMGHGAIYSFNMLKDGKLVADFVAVSNKTTGECGFYDLVTKSFFGRSYGSGVLTAGPDVTYSGATNVLTLPHGDNGIVLRSAGDVRDEIVGKRLYRRVGTVELGSLTWQSGTGNVFTAVLAGVKTPSTALDLPNIRCERYESIAPAGLTDKGITVDNATGVVTVKDTAYSTSAEFNAAMAGVMLNYELAEPQIEVLPDNWERHFVSYEAGTETFLPGNTKKPYTSPLLIEDRYTYEAPARVDGTGGGTAIILTDSEGKTLTDMNGGVLVFQPRDL